MIGTRIVLGLGALVLLAGCSSGTDAAGERPAAASARPITSQSASASPTSSGAILSLAVDQIEYAVQEEFLIDPSGSYCGWYGGTEAERTLVAMVPLAAEVLRVNILGDDGSIIGSSVAQPVGVLTPEVVKSLEESDALQLGAYALTVPSCKFTADFPDLPRDQNSYRIQVLADKVQGYESEATKTLTGTEATESDWALEVTIP